MKKYFFIYALYWQEGLARRSSFIIERFHALVVVVSLYYLWTALLNQQTSFAGYSREQMMTYVFGMSFVRSLVLTSRAEEIPMEINQGRLSGFLLKPVNYFIYAFSRDLSDKSINFGSALIEISALYLLFSVSLQWPTHVSTWILSGLAVVGAILLNFLICFLIGCSGFWTSESSGPRFLVALIVEFTAGTFFPLDILPQKVQAILAYLPSPYLVFFPLNIFLEKANSALIIRGFVIQFIWIIGLALITRWVWRRGVIEYGAQGS